MAAPSLCLNMIVKNEAPNIIRCLESVAPYVSCYHITDTGSTDDTIELIQNFFAARNKPGTVIPAPFVNFGQARNDALDICRFSGLKFDYILLMDADHELVVPNGLDFRSKLVCAAYDLQQRAGRMIFWNTRIISRVNAGKYVGVTHEVFQQESVLRPVRLDGPWVRDHCSGTNRKDKFERDIKLLIEDLDNDPLNPRSWFYLALSYRDAGRHEDAVSAFKKRLELAGWDEEKWYAHHQLARGLLALGDEDGFIRESLLAYNERPRRAEPLYYLAKYYRNRGQLVLAQLFAVLGRRLPYPTPEHDVLFIDDRVYKSGLLEEYQKAGGT